MHSESALSRKRINTSFDEIGRKILNVLNLILDHQKCRREKKLIHFKCGNIDEFWRYPILNSHYKPWSSETNIYWQTNTENSQMKENRIFGTSKEAWKINFEQSIIKNAIKGRLSRVRRKIYWLRNIQIWTGYMLLNIENCHSYYKIQYNGKVTFYLFSLLQLYR